MPAVEVGRTVLQLCMALLNHMSATEVANAAQASLAATTTLIQAIQALFIPMTLLARCLVPAVDLERIVRQLPVVLLQHIAVLLNHTSVTKAAHAAPVSLAPTTVAVLRFQSLLLPRTIRQAVFYQ